MTTIILKINDKSKKGKALLDFLKTFDSKKDGIQIEDNSTSPYNKEFVAKIKKARNEIKEGKTISIETNSIWESIE